VFQTSPRPYLVRRRWVYEKYWTWGEKSPLWQARVRGQFPEQAEDALSSLAWLEAAKEQEGRDAGGPLHAGIDVAGPGDDETVLIIRSGPSIILQQTWSQQDPRGEVAAALAPFRDRLEEVNIDSAGIGHYFAEHFSDLDYPVNFVNVGVTERVDTEQFRLLKDQLYWGLRQRCEAGDIAGLTDELAIAQLASIRYRHNARGQVEIESKDEARKRGVKSPDRAEAIMLAFADRTPGIMRYYQDMAEAAELGYRPLDNPPPSVEGADDDPGDLMQIYLNERERLAKLRR
jgi:phage terminase large subunit